MKYPLERPIKDVSKFLLKHGIKNYVPRRSISLRFSRVGRSIENLSMGILSNCVARILRVEVRRVFTAVPARRQPSIFTPHFRLSGFLVSFNGEFTEVR